jgi:hypothetical protein
MSYNTTINSHSDSSRKNLEWILVVLSSVLLGIWSAKETIAFRNILLISGTLFSIYYIVQEWRHGDLKEQCTIWKVLPILLLAFAFVWVIAHYFFFSVDPVKQFAELGSTWLRALMASIIGIATGLVLRYQPNRLNLLWLGILISFFVLFYQYIPRALDQNKLLVPDYDYYLFHLKFNTVLAGMILITGLDGTLLDHLRASQYRLSNLKFWYLLYWLLGTSLVLWSFVFIVDARSGIGLSTILYGFWFIYALVFFIRSQIYGLNLKSGLALLVSSIGLCLILYFVNLQTNVNKGWHFLLKDASIAVQIDRYPNWQNPEEMGYPKDDDGRVVTPNTYERIAWATAGFRAIITYPQGNGVLAYHYAKPNQPLKMAVDLSTLGIATHSGWIDLGLAFGIPILALIFSTLLLLFIQALNYHPRTKMTALSFVVLIASLYTVSEIGTQHGIEILFFLLAFVSALLFSRSKKILERVDDRNLQRL